MSGAADAKLENVQPLLKEGLFLPPLFLLLLSGCGLLITGLLGGLIFIAAVMSLLGGGRSAELLPLFSVAWSALLIFALFIPGVVIGFRQLSGKAPPETRRSFLGIALIGVILWAPLVFLGQWLVNQNILPWLVLPPLQVFGIAVPILFLIELGRRKLPHRAGSSWGVYSFGVVLTQPIILLAEIILLLFIGVLGFAWASMRPELLESLMQTAQRLQDAQLDPQLMEQVIQPYLQQPAVIYLGLAVGAGLVPLLEELFKPLAIWVMVGRKFTQVEGFVLGLFAGGTFALLESLGIAASVTTEGWSGILVARFGTAILHVTSTALVGWGLGAAWQQRKYLQLGVVFFLSFLLHGIWNLFGLLLGVAPYLPPSSVFSSLDLMGPVALGILALVMLLIIAGANKRLQKISKHQNSSAAGGGEQAYPGREIITPAED